MHGGAATNLAVATGKIPVTVLTVRFLIIEMTLVHEVDLFSSLLRELDWVPANILAESNVVLLEEIMIVQGGTNFEAMLSSTCNTALGTCTIWIISD